MNLRIASIDNEQFKVSVARKVWGSRMNALAKWQAGDKLLFFVDKHVAGLAEVAGEPFISGDIVWQNGVFPYRVPIKFLFVLPEEKRIPTGDFIRGTLMEAWGYNYGWGIQAKHPLPQKEAKKILDFIAQKAGVQ